MNVDLFLFLLIILCVLSMKMPLKGNEINAKVKHIFCFFCF